MTDLQAAIAAYHVQRFPHAKPEHVALKVAEEAGELGDAVLGMVSNGDFGKGDVVYEAVDVLFGVFCLLARWFPEVDPDAEVRARLTRFTDPNGGHRSCLACGPPAK